MNPVKKILLFALLLISFAASAQQNRLFDYQGIHTGESRDMVIKGTKLILHRDVLERLYREKLPLVTLEIPLRNEVLRINLRKANLFAGNFETIAASTLEKFNYEPGYYLQGTIEGKENSLAAISIFSNSAGGVLSFDGDNYNLCIANNFSDYNTPDYLLYADKDCTLPKPVCETKDEPSAFGNLTGFTNNRQTTFVGCPVDIHFEAAYKMYTAQGNNMTNVMNYLTTVFNSMQLLYSNENILVQIREVMVWNVPDPENSLTTGSTVLTAFRSRMSAGFNGDLAHYVTYGGLGGGVAYLNILCSSPGLRTAVSGNMAATYSAFPNFSFTVEVVTHETGHNLSSPHTQNCGWPGGAIDNCYATEGGCPPGPTPVGGGTIMSYCHLVPTGINFANGFGVLPGNKVRNGVTTASTAGCICNCTNIQLDITKTDIGCSGPTGTATAVVTGGTGPFTYLWSNGATTSSVSGLTAGTYYVTVTGATPTCTVVKGFKIITTSATAVPVTISPASTNVTKCFGETHTVTASTTVTGTVNYQWFKNAAIITGATSNMYTVTAPGNYYVQVSNGTCTGQSSTVVVVYQNIVAPVISINGSPAVCANDSVRLSIPATTFSIEWKFNGVIVPGATATDYFAKQQGNYSARLYSTANASCNGESTPVSITVKPVPDATTTPSGSINLCTGNTVTLSHAAVTGESYQWYNNNNLINGATNNDLSVGSSGVYKLVVTGTNGCRQTSGLTTVTVNALPDSLINPPGPIDLCEGGSTQLQVSTSPNANYSWYRNGSIIPGAAANILNVTNGGSYSATITNNLTGCFSTSDNVSVRIIPPPVIFAGTDTVLATGEPYQLHAIELSGLGINNFEWSPVTGLNDPFSANPVTVLLADQQYILKGTNPAGCVARDTINIKVYNGPAIYVPTAFSPNGDGLNDVMKCIGVGLSSFKHFTVYNRYGEKIFSTTKLPKGWDGTRNGTGAASGTYVWVAEAVDYMKRPIVKKGSFVLVR